jgi:hypothetical protein
MDNSKAVDTLKTVVVPSEGKTVSQEEFDKNPMQIELRGFELAQKKGGRWKQLEVWSPTPYGHGHAMDQLVKRQDRHPNREYAVRPVISVMPSAVQRQSVPQETAPQVTDKETNGQPNV